MFIPNDQVKDWRDLELKVKLFFEEMGYHAEIQKSVHLAGRGKKQIDVYVEDRTASVTTKVLLECKWWEQAVPQDTVHSFHTVMQGTGANTGFIVSKVAFQSGAKEAIAYTNINLLTFEELQHAYGPEWFRKQTIKVLDLEKKLREEHRLHFDQWNGLGHSNNMIFHTKELHDELAKAAKHNICLLLQTRAREPASYIGPEPVQMASNALDPDASPPSGHLWHELPSVRSYFKTLIRALEGWISGFDDLKRRAQASFDTLDPDQQAKLMGRSMSSFLEDTPVRVLKPLLPDDLYKTLLALIVSDAIPPEFLPLPAVSDGPTDA